MFLRFEDTHGGVNEWTYGEFDRVVEGAAHRLAEAGVGAGEFGAPGPDQLADIRRRVARRRAPRGLDRAFRSDGDHAELGEHLARTSPVVGFCAAERAETYRNAGGLPTTVIEIDESDPTRPVGSRRATSVRAPVQRWATGRP